MNGSADREVRPVATRRRCALLLLLAALCAPSCSLLPGDRETLEIFDLHAAAGARVSNQARVTWQLAVEPLAARAPVAGVRMAVLEPNGAYSVVRGARWSLPAPKLLQAVLVEGFEQSQRIAGVGPVESLRGQCRLGGALRAFHWRPDRGVVEVTVAARLQCGPANEVVAMRTFESRGVVDDSGDGAGEIARAFDSALAELTPALIDWVLANGTSG